MGVVETYWRILWQQCGQIIKWPHFLQTKSVEEGIKNPHKMTFAKIFCVDFTKFRGESVETGVKNPHKTNFFFKSVENVEDSKLVNHWNITTKCSFHTFHVFEKLFEHTLVKKYFESLFVEKGQKSTISVGIQQ